MYDKANINTYIIEVNDIFSDMDAVYPGFGETMYTATILETNDALRDFVSKLGDTAAFERWLSIVFYDIPATADIVSAISERLSQIYIKIAQIVTERLRGEHLYVIGYTATGLLLVSKEYYPMDYLKTLLGGLL